MSGKSGQDIPFREWVRLNLEKHLQMEASDDMVKYILSKEDRETLEEYLLELFDPTNSEHQKFMKELLDRHHPSKLNKITIPGNVTAYKKDNVEDNFNRKKKPKGKRSSEDSDSADLSRDSTTSSGSFNKSKTKYISIFSPESTSKDVIFLPGRHLCDCEATKHKLINNCLDCGRIVCEQEGSGPCLFCGELVCTNDEQDILNQKDNVANKLYYKLMARKRDDQEKSFKSNGKDSSEAIKEKDKLLEFDRSAAQRTKVIDDESDYYATESNRWLGIKERDRLKKLEEEHRAKRHASRLDRKVTLDFANKQVIEEKYESIFDPPEDITNESDYDSQSYYQTSDVNPAAQFFPTLVDNPDLPTIPLNQPEFDWSRKLRLQSTELQSISDDGMCLSMHQPWASLLTGGIKIHEGRTWYTAHRGRLWIASTVQTPTHESIKHIEDQHTLIHFTESLELDLKFPSSYPVGCLLGCVNVVDCLPQEEYRARYPEGDSEEPFVFIVEEPRELIVKFPMKGKHKIYKLDTRIHQAAVKSLKRV